MLIKPTFWWCFLVTKQVKSWIRIILIKFLGDLSQHKINLVKGKIMIQSILDWPQKLLTIILINISPIMILQASQYKKVETKEIIHNRHGERVHRIKISCNREMENNYLEMNQIVMKILKAIQKWLMQVRSHLFLNHSDR